jgi:hypothetical protein
MLLSFLSNCYVIVFFWPYRRKCGGRELLFFLLFSAEYVLSALAALLMKTIALKIFFSTVLYIGFCSIPITILLFALKYTGIVKRYSIKVVLISFLVPLVITTSAATNHFHHLFWPRIYESVPPLMIYEHGPLFYFTIFYSFMTAAAAGALFFSYMLRDKLVRKEGLVMLIGFLFPWWAGILYTTDWNPFPGFDIVALSTGFATLFLVFGIRFAGMFSGTVPKLANVDSKIETSFAHSIAINHTVPDFQPDQLPNPSEVTSLSAPQPLSENEKKIIFNKCMISAILLWEEVTGLSKADFAESSGLWNVQMDPNGWRRTQTLDRYLSIEKMPKKPRIKSVINSVEFVLAKAKESGCSGIKTDELSGQLEQIRYLI